MDDRSAKIAVARDGGAGNKRSAYHAGISGVYGWQADSRADARAIDLCSQCWGAVRVRHRLTLTQPDFRLFICPMLT